MFLTKLENSKTFFVFWITLKNAVITCDCINDNYIEFEAGVNTYYSKKSKSGFRDE